MSRRFWRRNEGHTFAGFSISLPVLLFMIAGIFEFSRLGGAQLLVNYGAREGARAASLGVSDNAIIEQIKQATILLDDSKLVVYISPEISRNGNEEVTVTVQYPVYIDLPIINKITGSPKWVSGSLTMQVK